LEGAPAAESQQLNPGASDAMTDPGTTASVRAVGVAVPTVLLVTMAVGVRELPKKAGDPEQLDLY